MSTVLQTRNELIVKFRVIEPNKKIMKQKSKKRSTSFRSLHITTKTRMPRNEDGDIRQKNRPCMRINENSKEINSVAYVPWVIEPTKRRQGSSGPECSAEQESAHGPSLKNTGCGTVSNVTRVSGGAENREGIDCESVSVEEYSFSVSAPSDNCALLLAPR